MKRHRSVRWRALPERNGDIESMQKILLIGFGNMGQALARGWLASGRAASSIAVVDPVPAARAVAVELGFEAAESSAIAPADVVVFAIKPAQVEKAAALGRAALAAGGVCLSIVAGKTLAVYASLLGADAALVRAMPNTPAAIGRGITVLCANAAVSKQQRAVCTELMAAAGAVEWVEDESLMDAVTAVSGSGPAYVFLLIECLAEAGRRAGLPADLAVRLARETVAGAGAYAAQADVDASELRRRVTSPNGTTQAALATLMDNDELMQLMITAVAAATDRSRELSGA
jgi:pyrroline-5-carboxylate reductase